MSGGLVVVTGSDSTMVNDAVHATITELLDGVDPAMALEDLTIGERTGSDVDAPPALSRLFDALNTPPFLVDRRVVVVRDAQALREDEAAALAAWSSAPTEGVTVVASVVGGRTKGALVKAAQRVVDANVGTRPKDHSAFVSLKLQDHGIKVSTSVAEYVAARLGDDMARVDSLARSLRSIYGERTLSQDDVEPYLGEAGDVPEWDLTDAIDKGRAALAIETLRRMLYARERSGTQIINILQRHYLKMARLEGSGVATGEQAAELVGGHPFPAKKLVDSARIMGGDRIAYAVQLIARADRDAKGGASYGGRNDDDVDQTDLTITEVLVARLAKLAESARRD